MTDQTTPPGHPGVPDEMTATELARHLGVARSTVTRALAGPGAEPVPPAPVNPGQPHLRWRTAEVVTWWPHRPRPGRPRPRTGRAAR